MPHLGAKRAGEGRDLHFHPAGLSETPGRFWGRLRAVSVELVLVLLFCAATAVAVAARRLRMPYTVALRNLSTIMRHRFTYFSEPLLRSSHLQSRAFSSGARGPSGEEAKAAGAASALGLLIHASVGSAGGCGRPRRKRSGSSRKAPASEAERASTRAMARPWLTSFGVSRPRSAPLANLAVLGEHPVHGPLGDADGNDNDAED